MSRSQSHFLIALLGFLLAGHLAAADGGFDIFDPEEQTAEENEDGLALGAPEEPLVDDDPLAPLRTWTSKGYIEKVGDFARAQGWATRMHGDGRFRILTVGADLATIPQLIEDAELALSGLEIWTGKQHLFAPEEVSDELAYVMVLFRNDQAFDRFLGWGRQQGIIGRPENEDIAKHTNNVWGPRVAVTEVDKLTKGGIERNIVTYLATGLYLRTFYGERSAQDEGDVEFPKWLVVGMQSELEQRICQSNRCYSINYETSSTKLGDGAWAKKLAKLIRDRSQFLLSADSVMELDLVSTPAEHYLQLWSLASFVRGTAGAKRFPEILARTARGESSADAIEAVLGLSDRGLTQRWLRWAAAQR